VFGRAPWRTGYGGDACGNNGSTRTSLRGLKGRSRALGEAGRGRRGEIVPSVLRDWECYGEEARVLVWEVSAVAFENEWEGVL
jgi:hypothetical protein